MIPTSSSTAWTGAFRIRACEEIASYVGRIFRCAPKSRTEVRPYGDFFTRSKQRTATTLLRAGLREGSLFLPHQAILEFLSVVTRPLPGGTRLLEPQAAYRETEDLLNQFDVLYPNDGLVRTAIRGAATYGLSWFDAHLWAYAEHYGLSELISEDFEHGRVYGTVRAIDPFGGEIPAR